MNSRQKGARGEREAAAALRAIGIGARRGQQFSGGPDSPDVVAELPGCHIEVKRTERLNLDAAMRQSDAEAGETDIPLVLSKRNRGPWLLTVQLEHVWDLWAALDAAWSKGGPS